MAPDFERAIAEEERLIALYQAELALSVQEVTPIDWSAPQASNDDQDNALDWILSSTFDSNGVAEDQMAALLKRVDQEEQAGSRRQELHALQAQLRGFCFTKVVRSASTLTLQPPSTIKTSTYDLHGYFTDNPEVKAVIHLTLELDTSAQAKKPRVVSVQPTIEGENWQWLPREAASKTAVGNGLDMARWMSRIAVYLAFDQRRQQALERIDGLSARRTQSKMLLELRLSSETTVSLIWGWSWKEEREVLKLTESSVELGLLQSELDMLVEQCGSVEKALEVMSTGEADGNRRRRDEPVDVVAEADDEESSSDDDDDDAGSGSDQDAKPAAAPSLSSPGRQLSAYERQRLERIKRNEAYLSKLGLDQSKLTPPPRTKGRAKPTPVSSRKRRRRTFAAIEKSVL